MSSYRFDGTTPLVEDLAEAVSEVLASSIQREIIDLVEFDEALGFTLTALIEAGIDDPEAFLREKGILA